VEFRDEKKQIKKLTPLQAREKIRNWCAYQERAPKETADKLYEYGLTKSEAEQILAELISENFLNEERYARVFASGKFRIKKWGRVKIKAELRAKKISDYSINKALKAIEGAAYEETIRTVLEKRMKVIKEPNRIRKSYKLLQYAASRGFEKDMVADVLKELSDHYD
jgi:regulatory protein